MSDVCDLCPDSLPGAVVSVTGCDSGSLDSDGDGVCDGSAFDPLLCATLNGAELIDNWYVAWHFVK